MVPIPKVAGVLSCGVLLCLVLSNAAAAAAVDDMKAGQSEGNGGPADQKEMIFLKQKFHIIQGDVMRVEYGTYFVKEKDGKEVGLETSNKTQMMGQIKQGDRLWRR